MILIVLGVYSGISQAKDMTSRLGVGYSNSFGVSSNMPSLAVKYYSSQDLALSAALGIDTNTTNSTSGNSNFGFGAKIYKTIFPEDNLNFYMGAGAGLISSSPASGGSGSTSSGFELSGFAGVEFFVPGLDSMGFNFQAGVGVVSTSAGVRFRTIGETPLTAGMYFYF
jgi:hypothetical protein